MYISLLLNKTKIIADSNFDLQKRKNMSCYDWNKEYFKLLRKVLSMKWEAHDQFIYIIRKMVH